MRFIGWGIAAIVLSGICITQASAQMSEKERNQFLRDMANIVAAESFCNLSYDNQAISDYIASKIPATDMSFGNDFRRETYNAKMLLQETAKEQSARTIYCTAEIRVAYQLGFIKNVKDGQLPSSF